MDSHPNDPLHGYTLQIIVERLVEEYGWDELAEQGLSGSFHPAEHPVHTEPWHQILLSDALKPLPARWSGVRDNRSHESSRAANSAAKSSVNATAPERLKCAESAYISVGQSRAVASITGIPY